MKPIKVNITLRVQEVAGRDDDAYAERLKEDIQLYFEMKRPGQSIFMVDIIRLAGEVLLELNEKASRKRCEDILITPNEIAVPGKLKFEFEKKGIPGLI